MKRYQARFFVPNNPLSPRISPEVAKEIGLNESLILLQLEFWMTTDGEEREDGFWWLRKTVREIQETFKFWGVGTISRTLSSLVGSGYIVYGDFDEGPGKGASWIRFNMEAIGRIKSIRLFQDGTTVVPKIGDSVPNGNNRPYIEDKEYIQTSAGSFDAGRSARLAARSGPVRIGQRSGKVPVPESPDPTTIAAFEKWGAEMGFSEDEMAAMWKAFRLKQLDVKMSPQTEGEWGLKFQCYVANCNVNKVQRRQPA